MADLTFKVDPKDMGVRERAMLRRHPDSLKRGFKVGGKQIVEILRRRTLSMNIWDRGKMYRGWTAEAISALALRVYNKEPHTVFVEGGRTAGATQPPSTAILQWVRRHMNVSSPKEARSIAFLIARAIGRRGIPARPVMTGPGALKEMAEVMQKALGEQAAKAWG